MRHPPAERPATPGSNEIASGVHPVTSRISVFNWRDEHSTDVPPPTVRADLLALDGTRIAVWEATVEPRCTAKIEIRALIQDRDLPGDVGAIKLVTEAEQCRWGWRTPPEAIGSDAIRVGLSRSPGERHQVAAAPVSNNSSPTYGSY